MDGSYSCLGCFCWAYFLVKPSRRDLAMDHHGRIRLGLDPINMCVCVYVCVCVHARARVRMCVCVCGRTEGRGTLPEGRLASASKETQPDHEDHTYSRRTKRQNGS